MTFVFVFARRHWTCSWRDISGSTARKSVPCSMRARGILHRELRAVGGGRDAAGEDLAGDDGEQRGAERGDAVVHRLLRAAAERDDGDDRGDADHDAEHRERRAELVGAQRDERDADRLADHHVTECPGAGRWRWAVLGAGGAVAAAALPGAPVRCRRRPGRRSWWASAD